MPRISILNPQFHLLVLLTSLLCAIKAHAGMRQHISITIMRVCVQHIFYAAIHCCVLRSEFQKQENPVIKTFLHHHSRRFHPQKEPPPTNDTRQPRRVDGKRVVVMVVVGRDTEMNNSHIPSCGCHFMRVHFGTCANSYSQN